MLAMENSSRPSRDSHHRSSSFRQRQSGYEPSDTETEWQESPWHEMKNGNRQKDGAFITDRPKTPLNSVRTISPLRNISPMNHMGRCSSLPHFNLGEAVTASKTSPVSRRNSKSPYKPHPDIDTGGSTSPFPASQRRTHISLYKLRREEADVENYALKTSSRRHNQRTPTSIVGSNEKGLPSEASRAGERSSYSHRSVSAPRKVREKDHQIRYASTERIGHRRPLPLATNQNQKQRESSYSNHAGKINEMIANAKLSKAPYADLPTLESIESITIGDIFFSRDGTALHKNVVTKNAGPGNSFTPKYKQSRGDVPFGSNGPVGSGSSVLSRTNTSSSRQSIDKTGTMSGSYSSGSIGVNSWKFTANRLKSQTDTWFGCVRRGPCRTSKTQEAREIDEASFIEKAFVVESLRQFWADKHQPGSLSGFICHKQQAQHLKQLISHNNCPHILFKGPSGSGKKALTMALLHDIYGSTALRTSHGLRCFQVQETMPIQVFVPLTSSPHHVELNLRTEAKNGRYALMASVKEITTSLSSAPEVSDASIKPDYKVIVLYEVDRLAENVQHLIKWIMDCYTDACKIILCCEDDTNLLESVKSRCKLITIDAPVTHEMIEVLIQIARKENIDLPMSFAAKIATKSKQNLRKAIMALEACKAHNYPFLDEQPIPLGWEEVLIELAEEILADPAPRRLCFTREKIQKLLGNFVHPKLILLKLVEQFLKAVEASMKRELYYWHAYYDKRLPLGTGALLKLEEFVAKFMSIYRKSFGGRRY